MSVDVLLNIASGELLVFPKALIVRSYPSQPDGTFETVSELNLKEPDPEAFVKEEPGVVVSEEEPEHAVVRVTPCPN